MSERINVFTLRQIANAKPTDPYEYDRRVLHKNTLLALLDVVEAAEKLATHMVEQADYPPDVAEFLWPLFDALLRFDFGDVTTKPGVAAAVRNILRFGSLNKRIYVTSDVEREVREMIAAQGLSDRVDVIVASHWECAGKRNSVVGWDLQMERPDIP